MPEPWHVRLGTLSPMQVVGLARGRAVYNAHVYDAATGADVSERFPIRCARRLWRSLETGQPVRVALFKLTADGRHYCDPPGRVAVEPGRVLVVGASDS